MLLSCCFRGGASKKKHKQNKKWENEKKNDHEYSAMLSQSLISSPIICLAIIKPVSSPNLADLSDNKKKQKSIASTERVIVEEKEVHVQRQKFDFLQKGCSSTPVSKGSKSGLKSPELLNISGIPSKTPKSIPQDVSAEDLDGSNLSVPHTHHSYEGSNTALAPSDTTSPCTIQSKQIALAVKEEIPTHGSGVENGRSLDQGEIARVENIKKIELLRTQQQAELERVKESFEAKLLAAKDSHRKDLEKAMTIAKNKANETISHLNRQIILERGKMFSEQQSNCKQLENEFKMKEDRIDKSMMEIEEREQTWQGEKAEVLIEVRRLKAEATQMASALAIEYEEENMGEAKKISLSQEVYSLELVVEMRTGVVKNLRDELARATQQLEQAECVKEKLRKATSRMEDLEEQLKIKGNMEKQLSVENNKLEIKMTNNSKEVDRMSKNVEALQWRIRNHFDVPVDNLTPETCKQEFQEHQRTSLPTLYLDQQRSCTEWISKHLISSPGTENQCISAKSCRSEKAYRTTTKMSNVKCNSESDIVHRSDVIIDKSDIEIDSARDVDSPDEGVGDVFSDGEHPESPHFAPEQINNSLTVEEPNILRCEKSDQIPDTLSTSSSDNRDNINGSNSQTPSPTKERLPSRFAFDN